MYTSLPVLFWQVSEFPVIKSMGSPESPRKNKKYHNHKLPCLFKVLLYTQRWCQQKYKKKQGGLYYQVSYSLIDETRLPHVKW